MFMTTHQVSERTQLSPNKQMQPESYYAYIGQLMRQGLSDKHIQTILQEQGVAASLAAVLTTQIRSQFREYAVPQSLASKLRNTLLGGILLCFHPLGSYLQRRRR